MNYNDELILAPGRTPLNLVRYLGIWREHDMQVILLELNHAEGAVHPQALSVFTNTLARLPERLRDVGMPVSRGVSEVDDPESRHDKSRISFSVEHVTIPAGDAGTVRLLEYIKRMKQSGQRPDRAIFIIAFGNAIVEALNGLADNQAGVAGFVGVDPPFIASEEDVADAWQLIDELDLSTQLVLPGVLEERRMFGVRRVRVPWLTSDNPKVDVTYLGSETPHGFALGNAGQQFSDHHLFANLAAASTALQWIVATAPSLRI